MKKKKQCMHESTPYFCTLAQAWHRVACYSRGCNSAHQGSMASRTQRMPSCSWEDNGSKEEAVQWTGLVYEDTNKLAWSHTQAPRMSGKTSTKSTCQNPTSMLCTIRLRAGRRRSGSWDFSFSCTDTRCSQSESAVCIDDDDALTKSHYRHSEPIR